MPSFLVSSIFLKRFERKINLIVVLWDTVDVSEADSGYSLGEYKEYVYEINKYGFTEHQMGTVLTPQVLPLERIIVQNKNE